MMRYAFFIVTMLLIFNLLYSQEELRGKKNIVFLELYGAADQAAGIGYERYFQLNRIFRYSLRAGLSHNPEFKYVPSFFGNSFMFGKGHYVEIGLNYMRRYHDAKSDFNSEFDSERENGPGNYLIVEAVHRRDIFNFLLRYRYQNERSGFMCRSFIGTPIEHDEKFNIGPI